MVDWNYHLGVFFSVTVSTLLLTARGFENVSPLWLPQMECRVCSPAKPWCQVCVNDRQQAGETSMHRCAYWYLYMPVPCACLHQPRNKWTLTTGLLVAHSRKADKSQVHCVKLGRDSQSWFLPDFVPSGPRMANARLSSILSCGLRCAKSQYVLIISLEKGRSWQL